MELSELEQTVEEEAKVVEENNDDIEDIFEAIGLLSRCQRLMAYMSDQELMKTITKRDRATMWKLSQHVRTYLNSVEAVYYPE